MKVSNVWFIISHGLSIIISVEGSSMKTSDLIRNLCEEFGISVSELARRIGQSPQNFHKKLIRETVNTDELMVIADALGIVFEQSYYLSEERKISIGSYGS